MPEKKLYKFCEDVQFDMCWDDTRDMLSSKWASGDAGSLTVVPDVTFYAAITWGKRIPEHEEIQRA